jgi:hypothetical protein
MELQAPFELVLGTDGNLAILGAPGNVVWATSTSLNFK